MNKTSSFETVDELMPWLEGREAEELRGWLREALEENSRLRQKLGRQAQRELGQALDLTVLKREIVQAIAPPRGGFVDWQGAGDYCNAMERACVDPLEELLEEGHGAEVVELAEWVLKLTERASEHVQDCGEIGMIWDRLQALHLEACRRAKPDGVALAGRGGAGRAAVFPCHFEWLLPSPGGGQNLSGSLWSGWCGGVQTACGREAGGTSPPSSRATRT